MTCVVIPNFNGAEVINGCLDALDAQTLLPSQVIVVDNGSTDGSPEQVAGRPGVQLIRLASNTGFAGAVNRGIAAVTGPRVAVLNSDAIPQPDWLAAIDQAPCDADIWAWGSVLLDPNGDIESAGDCVSASGAAFKAAQGHAADSLPEAPYEVFAPPGAAPVLRTEVVRALGGYDERFFLYYEDVDLAYRARLAGYRALVVPQARVGHLLAASSQTAPAPRRGPRYFIARNSWWCIAQNVPGVDLGLVLRATRREWRAARRDGYAGAFVRGRMASLWGMPTALRVRRRRLGEAVVGPAALQAAYGLPPEIQHLGPSWPES